MAVDDIRGGDDSVRTVESLGNCRRPSGFHYLLGSFGAHSRVLRDAIPELEVLQPNSVTHYQISQLNKLMTKKSFQTF